MRSLKIIARTLLLSYVGLVIFVYFFQENLLFFPDVTKFENCSYLKNFNGRAVSQFINKEKIRYYEFPAAGDAIGVMIHFHGNGGRACDWANTAKYYSTLGLISIFAEYPGYSEESKISDISEKALHQNSEALHDYVQSKYKLPIYLTGISLGTGVATKLASLKKVHGLILDHPYPSITAVAKSHYSILPVSLIIKHTFESYRWAPQVSVPVLINQGDKDLTIPLEHIEKQSKNFKQVYKLHIYKGKQHNNLSQHPDYWKNIIEYLESRISY